MPAVRAAVQGREEEKSVVSVQAAGVEAPGIGQSAEHSRAMPKNDSRKIQSRGEWFMCKERAKCGQKKGNALQANKARKRSQFGNT